MRFELKRVEPMRAANIGAVVYGIMTSVFALIFAPFMLLFALFAPGDQSNALGVGMVVIMLFVYPIMGLAVGWISGLVTAAAFNLVVRFTGGLIVDFDGQALEPRPAEASGGIAQ